MTCVPRDCGTMEACQRGRGRDALLEEQTVLRERAAPFEKNPARAREVIETGCARAREVAEETLDEVRTAVGTLYT